MSLSRETKEMLQSTITKMVSKYISAEESNVTDIHLRVNGENGELTAFDDDDALLARVHIKEWEGEHNEELYEKELQSLLTKMQREGAFDSLNIVKPYSFVLTDEEDQSIVDLLIIDDDTLILSADLLEGFDEEMNAFLKKLLEE